MVAVQFGTGAFASLITGVIADGTALPMAVVIAFSGLAAVSIAMFTCRATDLPTPATPNGDQ